MYPYMELFGIKLYMTGIGIVLACIILLVSTWILCKKHRQEFIKFFNWLPWLLLPMYVLGLYTSFILDQGKLIPTSLKFLSPYGYNFSLIGVVFACFSSVLIFLKQFRRNETKKIWIDILFFSFINAVIVLGLFLLLGDNFIGKTCDGMFGVTALTPDSALVKYGHVYPIWIFLSCWALIINILITIWKFITKKVGLGIWGFILLFMLLLCILPFWNYPAHGVISFFGKFSLDINHYVLGILLGYCLLWQRKLRKPY